MEDSTVCLLFIGLATVILQVSAKHCNNAGIYQCQRDTFGPTSPIGQDIAVHYDVIIESRWLFELPHEERLQFCKFWPHYETCLRQNVIPGCNDVGAALLKGLDDATAHFCSALKKNVNQTDDITDCVKRIDTWKGVLQCTPDLVNDTTGDLISKHDVCYLDEDGGKDCIDKAVARTCGVAIAVWFHDYFRRANKPMLELYNCHAWPPWITISLNVVIAVVLAVIILGCTVYCYLKVRRKKRQVPGENVSSHYRHLRSGSSNSNRNVAVVDAQHVDEGTELSTIHDRKMLISNEIC